MRATEAASGRRSVPDHLYLKRIGWSSCMEEFRMLEGRLRDTNTGRRALILDVVNIGRLENVFCDTHGLLPKTVSRAPTESGRS
jgi:hypothetical protein